MIGIALCLVAVTLLLNRIAHANDLRTRAISAADAAALGALSPLRELAIDLAMDGVSPNGIRLWNPGEANESARSYAERNNSDLVGEIHLSGFLGHTAKASVATKECQVRLDSPPPSEQEKCTDAFGETGAGRKGTASAIARLILPDCGYVFPPGRTGTFGSPMPSALVCDGVRVWPGAGRDRVAQLFKLRLVDKEDPTPYEQFPDLAGWNGDLPPLPPGACGQAVKLILQYALAQLGKPYRWGAEGPDSFDCSGLTMMAYRAAGIPITRVSYAQWLYPRVPSGQEQPGDLVFFNSGRNSTSTRPGHVGIVVNPANGTMINAPRTGDVVKLANYRGRSDLMGFTRPPCREG